MSPGRRRIGRRCREIPAPKPLSRLGSVPRPSAPTATVALILAAALALPACGGGDVELLPGSTAREINTNLDRVEQRAAEGDCAGASTAADEVSAQVEALRGVDAKLKRALAQGAARLREVVAGCEEATTEETEAEAEEGEEAFEPSEEEEPVEDKPRKRKPKPKAEAPAGEETERSPAPQPNEKGKGKGTEKPTPEAPAPEPGPGGTEAPGGISPSAPAGGE